MRNINNIKERIQAIANTALHPSPATLGVLGIMSLTALLGFMFLGDKSITFEEGVSVAIARLDWPNLWHVVANYEVNTGFYYILLHFWINLGQSEFAIRSLSVIFAILTVPAVYALGSRLFSRPAGLLAALFMAVNSYFILQSQLARGYSLLMLLVTVSSLLLITGLGRSSKRIWAAYIIISVLGMYTHVYTAFVLAAQAISLIFLRRREIPWKALLISWALIILLICPLLYYYYTADAANLDFMRQPSAGYIYGVFLAITGGSGITVAAYFIPCLIALVYAIKNWLKNKASYETWRYGLLLTWVAAPVIIAFLISQFKPIFTSRYFVICIPPLVLLAAAGIRQLSRRYLSWILIAALLATSGFQTYQWYNDEPEENWLEPSSYVLSMAKANDAIVFYAPGCSVCFNYYRDRSAATVVPSQEFYYDPALYKPIPGLNAPEGFGIGGLLPDPDVNLPERLSKYDRIWLVLSHDGNIELGRDVQSQAIRDLLEEEYGTPTEKDFPLVRVLRYD